jgi:hypothetical protein
MLDMDQAIPFLGVYKELKTASQKHTCAQIIIALFMMAQRWKQPKHPCTDNGYKNVAYTECGLLLGLKRGRNSSTHSNMDEP